MLQRKRIYDGHRYGRGIKLLRATHPPREERALAILHGQAVMRNSVEVLE
jgi:hypothetical protein